MYKGEVRIPDYKIKVRTRDSNDPEYLSHLEYKKIRDTFKDFPKAKVGVIDNGVDAHKDIADVIKESFHVVDEIIPFGDHATHIAGVISGDKYGLSYDIPICDIKVLSADSGAGTFRDVADGIYQADEMNIDVLILSLGTDGYSSEVENAISHFLSTKRRFVFVASGNDGFETDFPANLSLKYDRLFSVGSGWFFNGNYRLSQFSSTGVVDFVAQGEDVLSTATDQRYLTMSGTSMAAPVGAALCAIALGLKEDLTANDIYEALSFSCVDIDKDGKDGNTGYGYIIPMQFLTYIQKISESDDTCSTISESDQKIIKSYNSLQGFRKFLADWALEMSE